MRSVLLAWVRENDTPGAPVVSSPFGSSSAGIGEHRQNQILLNSFPYLSSFAVKQNMHPNRARTLANADKHIFLRGQNVCGERSKMKAARRRQNGASVGERVQLYRTSFFFLTFSLPFGFERERGIRRMSYNFSLPFGDFPTLWP